MPPGGRPPSATPSTASAGATTCRSPRSNPVTGSSHLLHAPRRGPRHAVGMRRREFIGLGIGGVATVSLGAAFWDDLFGNAQSRPLRRGPGYGPLRSPDANGIRLPEGFRSRLVARGGEPVPGTAYRWHLASDGMAAFTR